MQHQEISLRSTGYISKLICDYTDRNENVAHLYDEFPDVNGFKNQIEKKGNSFSMKSREVLFNSLNAQYKNTRKSSASKNNIDALLNEDTFTVVTGHQLNLFTGPLYFLYKIISTINLTKKLKKEFPQNNFVPVYWMATEDHDFEEINHFFIENSKVTWNVESSGAVGKHDTKGLEKVFSEFSKVFGTSKNAEYLKDLFQKGYLKHDNLTEATRYIVNEIFGEYGLVIVDGDDKNLKEQFIPYVEKELFEETAKSAIETANNFLEENYKVQVNPREINLFYINKGLRERIIFESGSFKINNTSISFSKEEILDELKNHPENFSPNVILRPLYQEVVLPNLCYIGGGGEIAYWLQLKEMFAEMHIPFPILLVRNSVLLIDEKQQKKIEKLNLEVEELFLKQDALINKKTKELSELSIDFSEQKEILKKLFSDLHPLVSKTDKSFEGALLAQEKKQLKGLKNLEKRLLKAEKKNLSDKLLRVKTIQDELFPRGGLQERNLNFSEFYVSHGEELISKLFKELDPLSLKFSILTL